MWQDLVAAVVALLAAGYLAWRLFRRRGSCSPACDRCPAASSGEESLVQLQPPEESPPEPVAKTQG